MSPGNEVSNTLLNSDADIIILAGESLKSSKLKLLASNGLAAVKKSGKSVLLQPAGCTVSNQGSILVAMSGAPCLSEKQWRLEKMLDLPGREAVVLSVSSPFYPFFGKVAAGMQAYRSEALQEIWKEQAAKASAPAELVVDRLKEAGAKSWFISRTGRFIYEIQKTVQSADTSIACLLIDQSTRRRWFSKSELADLMEAVNIPVMLVPCEY